MTQRRPEVVRDPWQALLRDDDAWDDAPTLAGFAPGGELIAVVGATGGAGTTLAAAGIALTRAAAGGPVALVEFGGIGDLGAGWGIPPDRTIDDLADVLDELGPHHLELVCYPHGSGVHLLLAPDAPVTVRRWDREATGLLLSCARALGDVVVDLGTSLGDAADEVCATADRVVIVAPPTVRGARRARAICGRHDLGDSNTAITVVANRGVHRDHLRSATFAGAVGGRQVIELPNVPRDAEMIEAGRLPASRRRGLAVAFVDLAASVGGQ